MSHLCFTSYRTEDREWGESETRTLSCIRKGAQHKTLYACLLRELAYTQNVTAYNFSVSTVGALIFKTTERILHSNYATHAIRHWTVTSSPVRNCLSFLYAFWPVRSLGNGARCVEIVLYFLAHHFWSPTSLSGPCLGSNLSAWEKELVLSGL